MQRSSRCVEIFAALTRRHVMKLFLFFRQLTFENGENFPVQCLQHRSSDSVRYSVRQHVALER